MVNTEVRKIILATFSIFGTVFFLLAMSCNAFADDIAPVTASSKFSVDVNNAVLELTIPSTPAVIDLNPTMTGSSFGSTNIDIKVATNNITGYTLTMTPTNLQTDTSLIRTELIGDEEEYREIETLELTDPISTGYTEQSFTTNKWGYKITGNNYYGINPENAIVSHPAWTTSEPTNGTNHNLTLAAKVDADTVSGAYETTLNFRAVTNATIAKDIITFDANGGTGAMDNLEVTAGTSAVLPTSTFTAPTGYRFSGWSTTQNGQGDGVRYYTNKALYTATDTGVNKHVTLYAQWTNLPCSGDCTEPEPDPTTGSVGTTFQRAYEIAYTAMHRGMYEEQNLGQRDYSLVNSWPPNNEQYQGHDVRFAMQDMTPEICASVTAMHDDYEALDTRDNKLYHITKIKDGKCWMTQNLDFDIDSTKTYTHYDTDLGWNVFNENATWMPLNSTVLSSDIVDGYFQNATVSANYPVSYDVGDWYFTDTWFGASDCPSENGFCNFLINNNDPHFSTTPFQGNGTHGHVGNYYNVPAAFANNYIASTARDTQNSICPAGWRVSFSTPNGLYDMSEEAQLNRYYRFISGSYEIVTDRNALAAPLYYVRAGYMNSSEKTLTRAGAQGYTWVNGHRSSWGDVVFFSVWGDSANSSTTRSRANGFNVRCLAR